MFLTTKCESQVFTCWLLAAAQGLVVIGLWFIVCRCLDITPSESARSTLSTLLLSPSPVSPQFLFIYSVCLYQVELACCRDHIVFALNYHLTSVVYCLCYVCICNSFIFLSHNLLSITLHQPCSYDDLPMLSLLKSLQYSIRWDM